MGALIPKRAVPGLSVGDEKPIATKRLPKGSIASDASNTSPAVKPPARISRALIVGGSAYFPVAPSLTVKIGMAFPKSVSLMIRTQST